MLKKPTSVLELLPGEHLDYTKTLNPSYDKGKMAGETGFEPATAGFGNQSSTS